MAWRAVLVPGPGAALIASIVTSTMLMRPSVAGGNAGPRIPCTASCQGLPRIMLVATNNGSDVARFREDNDLSPPMALTRTPQEVRFPRAAPRIRLGRMEMVTIAGNVTNVVIKSPLTGEARAYLTVIGVMTLKTNWVAANRLRGAPLRRA